MKREIIQTLDGSTTIHLQEWDECYHSKHGAIQEAQHVFIKNGLSLFQNRQISILEIGFGTGLNAFITFLEARKMNQSIDYVGVEAYPISAEEVVSMNYVDELNAGSESAVFKKMHESNWGEQIVLSNDFLLTKRKQFFEEIDDLEKFDLIYFDAFGYRVQPELWSTEIFKKMYNSLKPKGVLVTYAARGVVKRSMIEVGFTVEKLEGPPGKREMFRAKKK
ncbi:MULTISPECIES: tRNA (5-methylaminomethyl-2-thiouridine)(34)-methyltransferase MnmD [Flavobacterium]|uniref:tRNA (5-methylaminomethyl-2-thiouridine)(34)-methyltransferase MnmD n=1 Tax=Flavobacterium gawalongense TaxID=2594432 RepID=A0A553BFL5_9FLAO|nr:tRNA (5-methylaminomethyl-2-thiouridine)(34)-methyltransferase MnmD [Flavobacterium gawalongense]TRX00258.1 tRNA (5-methylaminomethyl-2-thiouridine)(34)-methyltransferase MnmD [Flavobacterium gawalongense]TRX05375.1 tRNA (5-methylaminomethyl-2-thiouridine)(34)-methyltransferase MnmD [Flavobacterium gawalongense]TRX07043.1 tRNA (5-methylaminomethyl-2-thiouridine)(34)-methyltransferase MnmD [Flavobacterium gawalongense]TRX10295.1 tRNA (5-methylaminomethyl-2-thiouridine)(34)-methyltransferase M